MGHVDVGGVGYTLPDGRPLLSDVTFRVGDGARVALVGPNGVGKSTLLRVVTGDLVPHEGSVQRSGGLGVMRQDVGRIDDDRSVRDLLADLAAPAVRAAAAELTAAELAMMEVDDEPTQLRYAQALADWADVGGYEAEAGWDRVTDAVLSVPFERAQHRYVRTLSGGEQKRLVLEALLRGPDEVLLLDEPDNALDVPTKRWLEERLVGCGKTVLFVSHDRELLARVATHVATLEPTAVGARVWVHGGGFASYAQARADRQARLEELLRRWEEEHAKLKELVLTLKTKAAFNDGLASRYQAAQTRLRKFEEAGPPEVVAREQHVRVRLTGGRTAKRAVVATGLELTGLMRPFDLEVWYGERVAVLGSNGSGKSHFLRLLAAGGSDPEHAPAGDVPVAPVAHTGSVVLGARVRPGWFAQNHAHPELVGRTLLEILHRGDGHRAGLGREAASRALDRYELVEAAEQPYETLSGGQQARLQILLLELGGATLLLLDEPTDNLDLHSAEALEAGLAAFDGTVLAVTHDRWFTRTFDRFLVFSADGTVVETPEPVWDAGRVERVR
ncbi:MAG: ABC-F family ATP-binding cassette domain-containing protein [Cellulomonas iranensis]|jgi:ATPase subunit of ABC transporter with duplicated ATPase domains|uniref:ATPase subunit of ABC transporter with duplicated ATPase domains n=1 Tax=Cellulomonas iranensis TaxID=76862 RepID=A0ABU0GLL8_9CELL|nr:MULTISPECIES: ATP-binding cassette domain-containing protein [Cellulomonas]MBO9569712.1 ABC-F family ATP-binding cassette domain-containing protein [Cellulomonas iranensis]MDQ0426251.1 ATPase subunit of ABC transporter with duplicated ATPase domains [Cellulomonas iranensis]TFH73937.1 ABC-F family ATP-binding cassette domain-containing protein [Cellulomonas sp. HD19AZ1]